MIFQPAEQVSNAYFPTTAIVSLHYITESGLLPKLREWAMKEWLASPCF
jgi:hypothetical protein